ncbi:choice-of-anchor D domain-containing protein, partial [Verrucomicrobiales bacterium]|nr:choice-of-anchor D domain-containing protein [Verrucomicrobiales bacterium]
GNGRTGKITVEGGETYSYSSFSEQGGDFPAAYAQTTDTGDGEPDANFAVWSGLNSADVNITVDRGSNNSGIHGFQIITDSSTEEPVGDDPKLALSIGAIAFAPSDLSSSQTFDISNNGMSQDLVIESITFTGEDADAFSATNPGTIAVGATGQSSVTFTPSGDGDYSAVLELKSNDPVSPVIRFSVTGNDPEGTLVWTVGLPGDGWPQGGAGGGPATNFVIEGGTNELPGDPANMDGQADDDYYFAGVYTTVLDGGDYEPVGTVAENEEFAERAWAGEDNFKRFHFNIPNHIGATTPLWVSWDATIFDSSAEDPRRGVEVYFNGNLIAEETLIRPAELGEINKTPTFLLPDVNGEIGEGFDNYVELRGIPYVDTGGGNWMGIDHVSLNAQSAEPGPNVFVKSEVGLGQLDPGAQAFILAISNVGAENALTISGVTVSGPDADKITIGDFPATIAPGATAQINYSFNPGRTGDFQFNIDIASDDVDETDKTTTVAFTAAVIDAAGPSAHYTLDEADGASEMRDITGYGRHGTYDGVTLGQDPLIPTGTAGGFGGGSHGEILGERLQMTDFTVSMWANPSELTDFQTLFSQGTGSPSFALVFTQTEVSWFNGDEATLSTETSPIAAGTPVHVATTFDSAGPTVTLFVDGVEVARLEGAPELDLNDPEQDSFYIGAFFAGSLPFSGTLDDVQVYNRVLNAGSVKALFDNPGEVNTGSVGVPPAEGGEITDVSRTAAGVSLSLPDGTTFDIEYSTDLENWSNVATDVTGSYEDTDAGRTGNPAGFYRGVVK